MLLSKLKVMLSHRRQYIPKLEEVELPAPFRGLPRISRELSEGGFTDGGLTEADAAGLVALCPSGAIGVSPLSIDLGRCVFCGECAIRHPQTIRFSQDYHIATNIRERLIITGASPEKVSPERVALDADAVRAEIRRTFGHALRLRQVSAGGDASTEMELNATMNVNFDLGRYGIEFVASPRHADGVVITGPITENMAVPLEICYNAMPSPKLVILAGTDAISGGLFAGVSGASGKGGWAAGNPAVNRSFLERFGVDLYVPGNPVHPLTFIHGVMELTGRKFNR